MKALAAYRHASEMMQGSHIPHLCIGMELIRKEKKANLRGKHHLFAHSHDSIDEKKSQRKITNIDHTRRERTD